MLACAASRETADSTPGTNGCTAIRATAETVPTWTQQVVAGTICATVDYALGAAAGMDSDDTIAFSIVVHSAATCATADLACNTTICVGTLWLADSVFYSYNDYGRKSTSKRTR